MNERDSKVNYLDSLSRLWNIDDLIDMGLNIRECSSIPTIGDPVLQNLLGQEPTHQFQHPHQTPMEGHIYIHQVWFKKICKYSVYSQVNFLSETKEQVHHQLFVNYKETAPKTKYGQRR